MLRFNSSRALVALALPALARSAETIGLFYTVLGHDRFGVVER